MAGIRLVWLRANGCLPAEERGAEPEGVPILSGDLTRRWVVRHILVMEAWGAADCLCSLLPLPPECPRESDVWWWKQWGSWVTRARALASDHGR